MPRSKTRSSQARRDASVIARNDAFLSALSGFPASGRSLLDVEDARLFSPDFRPLRSPRRWMVPLLTALSKPRKGVRASWTPVSFRSPRPVAVCQRRAARREVLFARGYGGSGAPRRRVRRNEFSRFSCK